MIVNNYLPSENITLVDDVLTLGRTSIAGASRLSEKFSNATVRTFSIFRTMGLVPEILSILDVTVDSISYNTDTGKCFRGS